jgi:hypothetical protein
MKRERVESYAVDWLPEFFSLFYQQKLDFLKSTLLHKETTLIATLKTLRS